MDVRLHACSSQLLSPLVGGRVSNILLQTGWTSVNKALLRLRRGVVVSGVRRVNSAGFRHDYHFSVNRSLMFNFVAL